MRHKRRYIGCLILCCALLAMSLGQAEEQLPFQQIGVIDDIFLNERRIVVNDVNFQFPRSALVYHFDRNVDYSKDEERKSVSAHALKPGMRVGYTAAYNQGRNKGHAMQEVWILPRGKFSSLE